MFLNKIFLLNNYIDCFNTRYTTILSDIFINDCFFQNFYISSTGSVIYLTTTNLINFKIDNSIFYNCVSIGQNDHIGGGAIYFSCSNGDSIIEKVCANQCRTTGFAMIGQFSRILTSNNKNNQILSSSIIKCPFDFNYDCRAPLNLYYGNIKILNTNISNNYCKYQSGFSLNSPFSFQGKFLEISNNINQEEWLIYCNTVNGNISNSNIINIKSLKNGGLITISNSILFLLNLIFYNNSIYLFQGTSNLIVNNSYIDHQNEFLGSFISNNNIMTFHQKINYYFLNTYYCEGYNIQSTKIKKYNSFIFILMNILI